MFEIRADERDYAYLQDPDCQETNRYGKAIDLLAETHFAANTSLRINGDEGVGESPNRNKQHGFHFTADNCIGCHACEAACSEKNDLPPHIAFRSVGYVEGGAYPAFSRINVSMACNHCDNPVCLKGCPTRAYTKHPEYGAVIQDPDICFGCGYCTWVCPYNAPQLDVIAGHVQKCNMCVDRLEVGLKPACVSACLGNALNFGVIENTPENRQQAKTTIPGFPDPSITQPNIRFQQTKSLPREFTRTDSMPVKYHKEETFVPVVDTAKGSGKREWNLKALSSRENPLVLFTLVSQAVIGAFALPFVGAALGVEAAVEFAGSAFYPVYLLVLLGLMSGALFLSTTHLGRPWRFYRGFNNLRHSPLSREALGIALFQGFVFLHLGAGFIDQTLTAAMGWLAVVSGLVGLYFMTRIYRIKARPFWDHWQVTTSFFGTALTLGVAIAGCVAMLGGWEQTTGLLSALIVTGLMTEGFGLFFHARDLRRGGGEGAAAQHLQSTRFAYSYLLRNALMVINGGLALAFGLGLIDGGAAMAVLLVSLGLSALIGRALFYVLVVPTTMPGGFFWKNKGFEEHARATGLADRLQVGVTPSAH